MVSPQTYWSASRRLTSGVVQRNGWSNQNDRGLPLHDRHPAMGAARIGSTGRVGYREADPFPARETVGGSVVIGIGISFHWGFGWYGTDDPDTYDKMFMIGPVQILFKEASDATD